MNFLNKIGKLLGLSSSSASVETENTKRQQTPIEDFKFESVDVALKMLREHEIQVLNLSKTMSLWESNSQLYKWSNIANFIRVNPLSLKFDIGYCPKCNSALSKIEYSEGWKTTEILFCKECKTQFDVNNNELINNYQTEEKLNHPINLYIAEGDVLSTDLKNTLTELNPRLIPLLSAINKLNCPINIYNYEYLKFTYNDKTFIVWLDEENILHYPNWLCIDKSNFTQDIIHKIQVSNQFSLSCTYWLFDEYTVVDKCCYLSSNIDLYKFTSKPIESSALKECLDRLICEADKTVLSFSSPAECESINYDVNLDSLEELLRGADCQDVNRDEDGDISFKFNGYSMYIRILDANHVRIFWHCAEFNNLRDNVDDCEDADIFALLIQWSNMGYPYKCTYYKPTDTKHSITSSLDFDLNFIIGTTPEHLNSELTKFVDFNNSRVFTDEDYFLPIQDYYLPIIYEVTNFNKN